LRPCCRKVRLLAPLCCAAAGVALLGATWRPSAFASSFASPAPLRGSVGTAGAASVVAVAAAGAAAAPGATRRLVRSAAAAALALGAAALVVCHGSRVGQSGGSQRCAATTARAASFCEDPEATDPSLFVTTNVEMGEKNKDFMLAASKAVAKCLGKPESYVAVCVQDGQDVIWGGSDAPCALCKVLSLGSINLENNKALTIEVSALLAEFNVPQNRIYINFFDLERQNVGYNGATFAG